MAEVVSDSDSDGEDKFQSRPNPPAKRRRIIDPSAIIAVPIYSNKVNSSLQLKPAVFRQVACTESNGDEEANLWSPSSPESKNKSFIIALSDSEEEPEVQPQNVSHSPSPPPPPCTPTVKKTKRANKKIREFNKKLDALGSLVSPSPERLDGNQESSACSSLMTSYDDDDDDIIIVSPANKQKRHQTKAKSQEPAREISLKFRWRTDLYKILVLSTDPLRKAVDQLSAKLKVPSSKILLLRKDIELPVQSTAKELGLGIADIIDCVVITENKDDESNKGEIITVRLQGKEKASAQEYSLHKDAPLGSVLSEYLSGLSAIAKRKVKFLFDGSKVTPSQTPSQLDMEDGDVIEVWA